MGKDTLELLCYKDAVRPVAIIEGDHELNCYVPEPVSQEERPKTEW